MLLVAAAALKVRPIVGLLVIIFIEVIFRITAMLLFNVFGLWIDFFYPAIIIALLYISLTLYKYIGEWKKMLLLENELGIAKKIQQSFLPTSLPQVSGVDMDAAMFTARQVGGDMYDFKVFEDSRLGVMIGDVSGKGVPASLFMAMTAGEFKFFASQNAAPESVLSLLNSRIVGESRSNLFVTMFYIVFDLKNKKARYSNGAHLPVVHLKHTGQVDLLDTPEGTPLGLIESEYVGHDLSLEKGDIFVFYTDGVTEAMNKKKELYTDKRLLSVIKASASLSAREILQRIEKDVRAFEPKSNQHDDITIMVVRIN
jgi:sigma-B regulation protein RsbU (phosphoserine phosphatase)